LQKIEPPNWLNENTEVSLPVFNLLRYYVVLAFPKLELLEAVRGFVWVVGKVLTETVVAEKARLAKRIKDPKRLETPLPRAIRHVRDYYVTDVRDHPDDLVAGRIARWTDKMKQLPQYKKLDAPHPAFLALEYDMLRGVFDHIKQETGFERWEELAREFPQEDPSQPTIPIPFWPDSSFQVSGAWPDLNFA